MNPVSDAIEKRKEVPMDQILPTTVPVTEPVSEQPRGRVGRRPFQDYVGKCKAKIQELKRKIERTQDPAQLRRLRAQLQAVKQRMNKKIQEDKEKEHLEILLCFLPADKRILARQTFFDFINVSTDDFKDIFEK